MLKLLSGYGLTITAYTVLVSKNNGRTNDGERGLLQLRTSLGKALARKKDNTSASGTSSSTPLSPRVTHAASLSSIPQQSQSSWHDQHCQQSVY